MRGDVPKRFDLSEGICEQLRQAAFEENTTEVRLVSIALAQFFKSRAKTKEPVALDAHLQTGFEIKVDESLPENTALLKNGAGEVVGVINPFQEDEA